MVLAASLVNIVVPNPRLGLLALDCCHPNSLESNEIKIWPTTLSQAVDHLL